MRCPNLFKSLQGVALAGGANPSRNPGTCKACYVLRHTRSHPVSAHTKEVMPVKESMQYPQNFPPESRSRVEAERLRAGKDFDQARQNAPHREYDARVYLEAELRRYILRPFAVFVSELCKRGSQGIVQVDEIEKAAWEFLRRFTIHAKSSKGFDKFGRKFAQNWTDNWGHLQPSLKREFERSDEWRQFQEELLHVAECQAMRASDAAATAREEVGDVPRDSAQSERTETSLNA